MFAATSEVCGVFRSLAIGTAILATLGRRAAAKLMSAFIFLGIGHCFVAPFLTCDLSVDSPLIQFICIQFTLQIGLAYQVIRGRNINLPFSHDRRGEFDSVTRNIYGVRSAVVELSRQTFVVVTQCRGALSRAALQRFSTVNHPHDSIRRSIG